MGATSPGITDADGVDDARRVRARHLATKFSVLLASCRSIIFYVCLQRTRRSRVEHASFVRSVGIHVVQMILASITPTGSDRMAWVVGVTCLRRISGL